MGECYWCGRDLEADVEAPAVVHFGLATVAAHESCCDARWAHGQLRRTAALEYVLRRER